MSLKEGPEQTASTTPGSQPKKSELKKEKKDLEKQAKEQKKEEQKKLKEAKAKEAEEKWQKKLEEATQVAENERDSKVNKMLQMVSKAVADLKKACKKANDPSLGKEELVNLEQLRSQLEEMQVETDLQDVKKLWWNVRSGSKLPKPCCKTSKGILLPWLERKPACSCSTCSPRPSV